LKKIGADPPAPPQNNNMYHSVPIQASWAIAKTTAWCALCMGALT